MKLSEKAINALIENQNMVKQKVAIALGCSEGSINRYIRNNDDCLTKAAAIEVIKKETGLTRREILEKDSDVGSQIEKPSEKLHA